MDDDGEITGRWADVLGMIIGQSEATAIMLEMFINAGIVDLQHAIATLNKRADEIEARADEVTAWPLRHVAARLADREPPALPPLKERH